MKTLVLDSVSSPITKRVYNMALDEFYTWFQQGTTVRFHQGDRERMEGVAGGTPRAAEGYVFRPVNRANRVTGEVLGEKWSGNLSDPTPTQRESPVSLPMISVAPAQSCAVQQAAN